jgi:hypothetical protein
MEENRLLMQDSLEEDFNIKPIAGRISPSEDSGYK